MTTTRWTGPTIPAPPCPQCIGPWLYNIVFQHADTCPLRIALDATQANDHAQRTRTRPATLEEITLCAALGAELTGGVLAIVVSRPPIWLRKFVAADGGFNPDLPVSAPA